MLNKFWFQTSFSPKTYTQLIMLELNMLDESGVKSSKYDKQTSKLP